MYVYFTTKIGLIFESQQISRQFSIYAKQMKQFLDQNYLLHM